MSGAAPLLASDPSDPPAAARRVADELLRRYGLGTLLDPIKTTVVQNQRAMTTWVARKNP